MIRTAAVILTVLALWTGTASAKTYTIGFTTQTDQNLQAQFKTLLTDAFTLLNDSALGNTEVMLKTFPSQEALEKAAAEGTVEFLFAETGDASPRSRRQPGFDPLVTYTLFKQDSKQMCLWVSSDSPYYKTEDLRGHEALTLGTFPAYRDLRELVGEAPDRFFRQLTRSPNHMSSVYAVSLGQVDAGVLISSAIDNLQANNPGPLKKIRKLGCLPPVKNAPLLASHKVPAKDREALKKVLLGFHENKALAKFHLLMKRLGFRFVPVEEKAYENVFALYEAPGIDLWRKDYATWERIANALK